MTSNEPADRTGHPFDDSLLDFLSGDPVPHLSDEARAEIDALNALLADPTLWAEPPADLEDRIVAAIQTEAAQSPTATTAPAAPETADAAEATAVADAPVDLAAARAARTERSARSGHRAPARGWRRPGFLVAAAATVAAVAVGAVLVIRALLPQPQFQADLLPTDLIPGASGSVTMTETTSGWDIRLDATGLPRLDGGQFYQAWLRNEAGVLVPIGSFNEGTDVTLWAGVRPQDFGVITITMEQADNDQASSGQRVLVGTVVPR